MPKLRFNLAKPLTRWEGYAMAIVFVVVVWQFGSYLDHRRAISDDRQSTQNSQFAENNKKLITAEHTQRRLNAEQQELRAAVCTIFDGIPAPPKGTPFGSLWRHAQHEAKCNVPIVVHRKTPSPPSTPGGPQPQPTVTITAHPRPTTPHPRPTHRRHPHPTPKPTCLIPTGPMIHCIEPPTLSRSDAARD